MRKISNTGRGARSEALRAASSEDATADVPAGQLRPRSLMKTTALGSRGNGRPAPAPPAAAAKARPAKSDGPSRMQKIEERIAAATEELAAGITEAASAAEELRRAMEQIASGAEEAAS